MSSNPINYDTKTFESVLAEINSNGELRDKPDWSKRGEAGIRDMLSLLNNAVANNVLLDTAFTRRNIEQLLKLIDYTLTPQSTATGTALFFLKSTTIFPLTVAEVDVAALTPGTSIVASKRFEGRSAVNVTSVTDTFGVGDVVIGTDIITVTRDFTTGEKVRLTTSSSLPSPLAIGTDYYVIRVSATTIKLATTLANANAGTQIDITTTGAGTQTITLYSFLTTVYQQIQLTDSKTIGESDGITEFQEFIMPDKNIILDTLVVTINAIIWTQVDTLVDSSGTDTVYRVFYDFDGNMTIQFGNNTLGAIPGNFDISAIYAVGGGVNSNVQTVNGLSIYAGSDVNIEGVTNPAALTGGADVENTESAKRLGPALLKTRDRFITSTDGEALALAYPGISLAKENGNAFGVLSSQMVTIADGGGNPSGATKTALQEALIDVAILESVDVRVEDTTITSTNVTSAAKMKPGYTYAGDIENYFRLAWELWLSETGFQIQLDFLANGVASAITLINNIFTETFSATVQSDVDQITILLQESNFTPRDIGVNVRQSDTFAYIEKVTGIDYFTTTLSFPIVLASDEITTDGTLALTEIP
jgi:hypothetical protein